MYPAVHVHMALDTTRTKSRDTRMSPWRSWSCDAPQRGAAPHPSARWRIHAYEMSVYPIRIRTTACASSLRPEL